MATLLHAVVAYGPRIELMDAAAHPRFMQVLTRRPALSAGGVKKYRKAKWKHRLAFSTMAVHTGVAIFSPRKKHRDDPIVY